MARIVDRVESHRGRPQVHPWDEWTDGQVRELFQGEDFDGQLQSMRTIVHRKARDMGLRARTHINKGHNSITVEFRDDRV